MEESPTTVFVVKSQVWGCDGYIIQGVYSTRQKADEAVAFGHEFEMDEVELDKMPDSRF
ncbi:hypothetical protein IC229_33580 [Spirosoma sp. BT702]|uniref:Uncharacterized protein n=1 Tax=Spirosoma profusum TaxID=2771354 RepID=A0A927AW70_9BACT|nr:hypothetical protein [Spirosoma profusum]MBD2705588.1 hypothetical protein [Spirosoma profusum]